MPRVKKVDAPKPAKPIRNMRVPALLCPKCGKGNVGVGMMLCTCGDGPAAVCGECGWGAYGLHPEGKVLVEDCVPNAVIVLGLMDAMIHFKENGERDILIPKRGEDDIIPEDSPEMQVLKCVMILQGESPMIEAEFEKWMGNDVKDVAIAAGAVAKE